MRSDLADGSALCMGCSLTKRPHIGGRSPRRPQPCIWCAVWRKHAPSIVYGRGSFQTRPNVQLFYSVLHDLVCCCAVFCIHTRMQAMFGHHSRAMFAPACGIGRSHGVLRGRPDYGCCLPSEKRHQTEGGEYPPQTRLRPAGQPLPKRLRLAGGVHPAPTKKRGHSTHGVYENGHAHCIYNRWKS